MGRSKGLGGAGAPPAAAAEMGGPVKAAAPLGGGVRRSALGNISNNLENKQPPSRGKADDGDGPVKRKSSMGSGGGLLKARGLSGSRPPLHAVLPLKSVVSGGPEQLQSVVPKRQSAANAVSRRSKVRLFLKKHLSTRVVAKSVVVCARTNVLTCSRRLPGSATTCWRSSGCTGRPFRATTSIVCFPRRRLKIFRGHLSSNGTSFKTVCLSLIFVFPLHHLGSQWVSTS